MFSPAADARAQELMPATSSAWSAFAPRAQSAPGTLASAAGTSYTLEIFGNGVANVYGGWRTRIQGLTGGSFYRFRARALPNQIPAPRESVTILLRWRGSFSDRVAPDYVWEYRAQADGSLLFDRTLQAPPGTSAVDVELVLQWAPGGRVAFDALSFAPAAAPAPRPVKLAAVYFRPSGTTSGLDSVQRAARYGEEVAATHRPDVMVFGEMLNIIGAPGTFDDKAETVPGPSTDVMASLASAYSVNVVFGMLERQNGLLYNTAVLIDRNGTITGKYRKVQLPLSETSSGVAPGTEVPVFQTDIGRVALLICQDMAFPEPAREAAIQGAELLLVPIWGGKPALVHARAIEQSAYVVASGYDYLSEVVDPLGTVLARVAALGQSGVAVATVDLSRRFREDWSGDWRDVSNKERRTEPYKADEKPGGTDPPPPPPNSPPAVTLTSPAPGSTYSAPAMIALSATASDSDGSVAHVDFYAGTTLIASDTTSPYSATWSNVPAGSYSLTARATDDAGATTTSAAVAVTVTAQPGTGATEVVLYAAAATRTGSAWTVVSDPSAAGGSRLQNPNAGAARVTTALANPASYAELTFTADAGKPYRLWVRGRADSDSWTNDSIHVQFDGAVDASGAPVFRIGTQAAAVVNLEDCGGCGLSGWGWQDNGYGAGVLGPAIYFATSGTQRLRIQVREDGFGLDQIVLSAGNYLTTAPGPLKNDATILAAGGGAPSGATEAVLYAAAAARTGSSWTVVSDPSAAGGSRLQNPNAGAARVTTALANPASYAELTFTADAGKPYRLWVRGRADSDSWTNDSIHVQFDGAVDASGAPVFRIGTQAATVVNLEDCGGCGVSGWGWQDNGYGAGVLGPAIYFAASGTQRLRIQVREDGFGLDQIVLSAGKYLTTAPGTLKNDATIIQR